MDLYEYQAKELFTKHGVPGSPGVVVTDAAAAEAAATELGTAVMVKSQVKTGGRGKAGGVKFAATPADAREKAEAILGLDIKGHVTRQVLITTASDIAEEYYVSYLLDRSNRTFLAMASKDGGMEIEQLAVERPEALARIPVDAGHRRGPRQGRRDRRRRPFPGRGARPGHRHPRPAVGGLRGRGRHAGRGQPAGQGPGREGAGAGRQGLARRERRVPAPRPCRLRRHRRAEPARGARQGEGPQLRQARRPGRASSATAPGS